MITKADLEKKITLTVKWGDLVGQQYQEDVELLPPDVTSRLLINDLTTAISNLSAQLYGKELDISNRYEKVKELSDLKVKLYLLFLENVLYKDDDGNYNTYTSEQALEYLQNNKKPLAFFNELVSLFYLQEYELKK